MSLSLQAGPYLLQSESQRGCNFGSASLLTPPDLADPGQHAPNSIRAGAALTCLQPVVATFLRTSSSTTGESPITSSCTHKPTAGF